MLYTRELFEFLKSLVDAFVQRWVVNKPNLLALHQTEWMFVTDKHTLSAKFKFND